MTHQEPSSARTIGPYLLESQLGQGGMGTVFIALHERLQRRVALKQIRPDQAATQESRDRFLREARSAARLNHPSIVQVHDIFEADDCEWIVMELAEGPTLAELLRSGPLPWRRIAQIGREIADGLAAAHLAGILHRDLKPENIVVGSGGHVKILDFGLAKSFSAEDEDQGISRVDQILGTPRFMSPEQAMGRPLDGRSDLFSLGSMLYEMLTGKSPFNAPSTVETLTAVCTTPHQPIVREETEPEALFLLIDRLLAKNVDDRPESAEIVVDQLGKILGENIETSWIVAAPVVVSDEDYEPSDDQTLVLPASRDDTVDDVGSAETILEVDEDDRPSGGADFAGPTSAGLAANLSSTSAGLASGTLSRERRQVTVLWCELGVGGAAEPDELYEVLPEAQNVVREVLARHDGALGNVLGHRLVGHFGYPSAREDDARRSVLAAIALRDELDALGRRLIDEPLIARIGVHTGPAIVMPDQDPPLALGKTLDPAQEQAALARSGDVVISAVTRRLVVDYFALEEVGGNAAGGKIYRIETVLQESDGYDETQTVAPLSGRANELGRLLEAWRRAQAGRLQTVQICGPAGIGKSRLVRALYDALQDLDESSQATWLSTTASPYARGSALHPILALLRRAFAIEDDASPGERLERLEEAARRCGLPADEIIPLTAAQFGVDPGAKYPRIELSPEKQRRRAHEAILALILALAEERPLILVIEDLHQADPSTLDLLHLLIEQDEHAPLLLLLTYRPDILLPWGPRGHLEQINLGRLEDAEAKRLITAAAGGRPLPDALRDRILAKTDGVPLFLEELTRSILESDHVALEGEGDDVRWVLQEPLQDFEVPATLRDSLAARLDRLGPAKAVAQLASVIGREAPFPVLRELVLLPEEELRDHLDHLVGADLLQRRGFGSRSRYLFRQAMVRDAAYDSLLARQRREAHAALAEILTVRDADPGRLAHHFERAGRLDAAIDALETASRQAAAQGALIEAARSLEDALTLLDRRPHSPQRDAREMVLQLTLGSALMATRGYAAEEVGACLNRARELSTGLQEGRELFPGLWGFWAYYVVRADFADAAEAAVRMSTAAEKEGDDSLLLEAHFAVGLTAFFQGRPQKAYEHLEAARRLDHSDRDRSLTAHTGQDAGVCTLTYLGLTLWMLDRADEAMERSEEAIELARRLKHPFSLAYALNFGGWLFCLCDEPEGAAEIATELIALSEEHGFFWQSLGSVFRGWAQARLGDAEGGYETARTGLDQYRLPGARLSQTLQLAFLAEICRMKGDSETARKLIAEALVAADETGELFWTAELHRLRGAASRDAGDAEEAAFSFERATEIARSQRAVRLEGRVADARA